jgi:hypothetical protein
MSASLFPTPVMQFFTANGVPLSGGKLYTYAAGTVTPLATYTDYNAGTANTNPVILNSRGEATVWLSTAAYYFVLKDSTDTQIWTADNVAAAPAFGNAASFSSLTVSGLTTLTGGVNLTSVAGTSFIASTFTPAISIGGSAPTSYTTQVGNCLQVGKAGNGRLFFTITVRLNVAGAATGIVTFTGLPVAARAGAATERNSCAVYLTGQATGLTTEQIWASVAQGASIIDLWTYTAGTAQAFTIGTLSNSVQFNINGSYPI